MNAPEKREFVNELVKNVADEIIANIDANKIPEDWDGIELRWYLADKFGDCVFGGVGSKRRKAEYNNTVLTNDL